MTRDIATADLAASLEWKVPSEELVAPEHRAGFRVRLAALYAFIHGASLRKAARDYGVNRSTLSLMVTKAFERAADGTSIGYRACVPWGQRRTVTNDSKVPGKAEPHAMRKLLCAHPDIASMLDVYKHALPPGRLPASFDHLLRRIRGRLKELGFADRWPLNTQDRGRRAFTRQIRKNRELAFLTGCQGGSEPSLTKIVSLNELFARRPYDRCEFDAHSKDVTMTILVPNARGELVKQRAGKIWVLVALEVDSSAVLAWKLVLGQSYTALDVAQCFGKAMRPWEPRALVAPDMVYAPGATMPQNIGFGPVTPCLTAMDNAMAHRSKLSLEAWTKHHGGILNLGRAHVPQGRPHIENFFRMLEEAALRFIPGGRRPASKLGEFPTNVSEWASDDHPVDFQALEDLLDVIMTGVNVTALPSRQQRTPVDVLLSREASINAWPSPPHNEKDAKALTTQCRYLRLVGSKKSGKTVHVNLIGASYHHPKLDQQWDLVGRKYAFLVDLEDLRTIIMVDDSLREVCVLEAAPPWNVERHDLTTRRRIRKLSATGELEINGAYCAISAYAAYTSHYAGKGRSAAVDQVARLMQLATGEDRKDFSSTAQESSGSAEQRTREAPLSGRVSFDNVRG